MGVVATSIVVFALIFHAAAASEEEERWVGYKLHFHKTYNSPHDELAHRIAYAANVATASEMAKRNPLAVFGDTELSDLTKEEMIARYNHKSINENMQSFQSLPSVEQNYSPIRTLFQRTNRLVSPLSSIDWRSKGAVTPVKDQGRCGSCWAFATVANIESAWFLSGRPLIPLSEQQLVSCDNFLQFGCYGGTALLSWAWLIVKRNGSLTTETAYPYASFNGSVPECKAVNNSVGARISGGKILPPLNVSEMLTFLSYEGPLVAHVDAMSLHNYKGGIITSCPSIITNHLVTIVGYGTENSTDYWIVKNSWNARWGEGGYFRVSRGKNHCLIELLTMSAVVAK